MNTPSSTLAPPVPGRFTLLGHLAIMRIDHWFKNVFVLPGLIAAIGTDAARASEGLLWRFIIGMISICLVASSNYVINEVLDAPSDRSHPVKRNRPTPAGRVNVPIAYVQWIALAVIGVWLGYQVSTPFAITVFILWVMGCIYNIPPVRSKDLPYIDVLPVSALDPLSLARHDKVLATVGAVRLLEERLA